MSKSDVQPELRIFTRLLRGSTGQREVHGLRRGRQGLSPVQHSQLWTHKVTSSEHLFTDSSMSGITILASLKWNKLWYVYFLHGTYHVL